MLFSMCRSEPPRMDREELKSAPHWLLTVDIENRGVRYPSHGIVGAWACASGSFVGFFREKVSYSMEFQPS